MLKLLFAQLQHELMEVIRLFFLKVEMVASLIKGRWT